MIERLGILGSPDSWYVKDLRRAANLRDKIDIAVLSFAELAVELDGTMPCAVTSRIRPPSDVAPAAIDKTPVAIDQLDALIVRTMPLGSLEQVIFRMDALQVAEACGVVVANPPRTLEVAIDKWLTLHRLKLAGLPIPPTIACQDRQSALIAFESLGGEVLVKPLFGGEGRGIIRVSDRDMAWRVFGSLEQLGQVLYLQKFLPHLGYDIRVLMIGNNILSVKRVAPSGQWRTNLSQGSVAESHKITNEQLDLALQVHTVLGGCMLGIDLLPTVDGQLVVLEVNAVPGWRGTAAALGVDIASLVLDTLDDLVGEGTELR